MVPRAKTKISHLKIIERPKKIVMVSLTLIKLGFIPSEEPLYHGNNAHVAGMVAMVHGWGAC